MTKSKEIIMQACWNGADVTGKSDKSRKKIAFLLLN